MEKKLEREIDQLDGIFVSIEGFCAQYAINDSLAFSIKLAVEELFTNLVKYNQGGGDHILLHLEHTDNQIVMRLTDYDVDPFDITQTGPVDVNVPLEERMSGGLGLHLVKSIVDKLTYEYTDRTMRITAIKRLEERDV